MKTIVTLLLILSIVLGAVSSFGPVLGQTSRNPQTFAANPRVTSSVLKAEKSPRDTLYEYQDALPKVAGRWFDRTLDYVIDAAVGQDKVKSSPKFSKFPIEKNKRAMLALDGGGVRGLITTYVLQAVEKEINDQAKKLYGKEKFKRDLRIGEVFDVVAGTSTGALLATYLTSYCLIDNPQPIPLDDNNEIILDGSAKSATAMYKAFAKKIFPPPEEPKGRIQRAKSAVRNSLHRTVPFKEFREKVAQGWEAVRERSLHSADGLDYVLGQAFPPEMTLNWLAEKKGNIIEEDGKDYESTVASLFVVSYDMVYRRPVAFYADRDYHRARFLTADPFIEPHSDPSSSRSKIAQRRDALEKAFKDYKNKHPSSELFDKPNLGDADIPLHKEQVAGEYMRYSRSLTGDVPISLEEVCRCSVAAPVYLPPGYVEGFYVDKKGNKQALVCCDGGVVANAPAQACFNTVYFATRAQYRQNNETFSSNDLRSRKAVKVEDFASQMVLSIGCGQLGRESDAEKVKDVKIRDYLHPKNEIGNLIEVLMSTGAQISHVNLEALFAAEEKLDNYLRIQLSVNEKGEPGGITNDDIISALNVLDNSTDAALAVYEEVGEMLASVYKHDIELFVKTMLELSVKQ